MSVQSEITRISTNVTKALTKIAGKGVTVPSDANSDDLETLIGNIPTAVHSPSISVTAAGKITATCGGSSATHTLSSTDDADFIASNIKSGKTIFGKTGTCVVPEYITVSSYKPSDAETRLKNISATCVYLADKKQVLLKLTAQTNVELGVNSSSYWSIGSIAAHKPSTVTDLAIVVSEHSNVTARLTTGGYINLYNTGTGASKIPASTSLTIYGYWTVS